ncbi:MAG: siphovirus ReqiPepy6 Gp37-like family protein, partial [Oscillospiraceae bacterium]
MQIEVYNMKFIDKALTITLEAVCDTFSSLLWDVEFYQCGSFEVYISASPRNIDIFQTGRIVARDDDKEHFGLIESLEIQTDAEDGDYLIVRGRFLMCLLERRIIYPTISITDETSYSDIVHMAVKQNAMETESRIIPGLKIGAVQGDCWNKHTKLQVSYDNLMEWIYKICEKIGGTANIRLSKIADEQYEMVLELSQGSDRSIMQSDNPHIIFSDSYTNLLSFTYSSDISLQRNFAYILGQGEGDERKRTVYFDGDEPLFLDRYEIYVDAKDISEEQADGETRTITEEQYLELLKERGKQNIILPLTASESQIAVQSTQFRYNADYFVGDYVTVEHRRFGLRQNKI